MACGPRIMLRSNRPAERRQTLAPPPPVMSLTHANSHCYLPDKHLLSACYGPVRRNETPCSCTGSGGRSTASADFRGEPAPRRRRVGAASVTPAGGCENSWSKPYSVLCLFFVPWESVMSDRLHRGPSPSALGLEGCSARPRLALRGLLTREAWCELEVTPQPPDKFVDRAEVCSMFVLARPSRRRGSAAGIGGSGGRRAREKNL